MFIFQHVLAAMSGIELMISMVLFEVPTPREPRPRSQVFGADSICAQAMAEARAAEGIDDFLSGHAIPSQRAAFLELLRGRSVYDVDSASMTLAPFSTVAAVSMPSDTDGSPELRSIAPPAALHYLEKGMQRMLRPRHEFNEMVAAHPVTPYRDRGLLRNRRKYLRLVKSLLKRVLVDLH